MNKKKIGIVLANVLTLLILASISFTNAEDIIVGIYNNPPLIGLNDKNEPIGFFVDLMNHVATEEGLKVEYSFDTLEKGLEKLEQGEIDILLGIAYSEKRAEKYIYSNETVYTNWGQIYSNVKFSLYSFLDLQSMNIGVERGDIHYSGENGIKNILDDFGVDVNYVEYPGRVEMLSDLEKGVIDAAVVSRLFGEYYESNYDIKLTPIQFNPIKIRVIAAHPNNNYLLDLFDKQMIILKSKNESIYYKGLNNLLSIDARPILPESVTRVLLILITALIASVFTIAIGKNIIKKQRIKLFEQNQKLKKIVLYISEFTNIKNMDKLFATLTSQLREMLHNDNIEMVSFIEHNDSLYLDSKEYITEMYKAFELNKIEDVTFKYWNESDFLKFKHSVDQCFFGALFILVKFHSSYNRQGYLYIEVGDYIEDKDLLQIYLVDIITNLQKIIENIKRVNEKTKLFVSLGELIEKRDYQVANHVKRVSEATKILAEACGYSDEQLNNIVIASSVHDIGKIFVPDSLLNKPGKLTDEEFEIVKKHATNDLKIMDDMGETLSKMVHNVVRYHHENWDGSGYPEKLCFNNIPYEARIVSVIDVFEALTHERPYKRAWNFDEAIKFILDNKGIKFDPQIVQIFEPISEKIYEVFRIYKDV